MVRFEFSQVNEWTWMFLVFWNIFSKNGLEAARLILCDSKCWPSPHVRVTSVKSLSLRNLPKAELTLSLKSLHCKHNFSGILTNNKNSLKMWFKIFHYIKFVPKCWAGSCSEMVVDWFADKLPGTKLTSIWQCPFLPWLIVVSRSNALAMGCYD